MPILGKKKKKHYPHPCMPSRFNARALSKKESRRRRREILFLHLI